MKVAPYTDCTPQAHQSAVDSLPASSARAPGRCTNTAAKPVFPLPPAKVQAYADNNGFPLVQDGAAGGAANSLPASSARAPGRCTSFVLQRPGVSVLFARSDSCYFDLVSDVWDSERDARGYLGSNPVVCHPPCRGWGRLRHLAKPRPDEKALALFAVEQVRRCGGVLEHPLGSALWHAAGLPHPGKVDAWGGWTLLVDQGWWGHAAPKPTYLYIVGCSRDEVGELPVQLQRAGGRTLKLSPAERERTPPKFAQFLVGIAAKCAGSQLQRSITVTASCAPAAVTAGQDRCYTELAASKRAAFKAWAAAL